MVYHECFEKSWQNCQKFFFLRPVKVRSDIVSVSKISFNFEIMQFEGLQKRKKIIFLFIIRSVAIFVMHRMHQNQLHAMYGRLWHGQVISQTPES